MSDKKQYTLYYSSQEMMERCPQLYLWSRGWGNIDVGGGPGRKKPPPVKDSKHHAVMGIIIQKVIENLYNFEHWKTPQGLGQRLQDMVEKEFQFEIQNNYIDWRQAPPKAELLQICRDGVAGFLRTMKAQRFLGTYARAEVDLLGWIDKYNPIGGRVDLLIQRDDTGVTILDGKNGKEKGKYTSPDQLRWYALCYYLAYGTLPDRLGFVYYRYPYGMVKPDGTIEEGVDWVPVTKADIEGIAERAISVRKAMEKEKFSPTPSPQACKFCAYETVCEARKEQKAQNAKNRKKKTDGLEIGEGFTDLEL